MKREILFSMDSPFRDTFRIQGFRFGSGEKSLAIVGAMRGDEVQQQFVCAQIVRHLSRLEEEGRIVKGHEILVIPSANPFSMNIEKRFWAMDNTDINRMFPGYDQGETTQRIAAALFEAVKGYTYGVQMASFYIPGDFIPHVRITRSGFEDVDSAKLFGMPYLLLRDPLPFDTTLLNYNWQIWETKAYSLYGGQNYRIDNDTTTSLVGALRNFMEHTGLIHSNMRGRVAGYHSVTVEEAELAHVKASVAGMLCRMRNVHDEVHKGDVLARIIDPFEGKTTAEVTSPVDGIIFYAHNKPLALQNTPLFLIL